jgi:hypothetical protein
VVYSQSPRLSDGAPTSAERGTRSTEVATHRTKASNKVRDGSRDDPRHQPVTATLLSTHFVRSCNKV